MGVIVLLVEGRRAKATSLAPAIAKAKYQPVVAHTGQEAMACIQQQVPHIVVFDATMMRSSGARTCRMIRQKLPRVPIIHCRADDAEKDDSAEADLYLQHPFTPRLVLNRIRKLLPATDSEDQIVRLGNITLYLGKRSVVIPERGEFSLTPKLVKLLQEFMSRPNEVITRRYLMQSVWKTDYFGDTRTLDVHIRWLREVLEETPNEPLHLRTVRGKGYILVIDLLDPPGKSAS